MADDVVTVHKGRNCSSGRQPTTRVQAKDRLFQHTSSLRCGLRDGGSLRPTRGGGRCRRAWASGRCRWDLRGDLGPGEAVGTDALCVEEATLSCRAHLALAAEGEGTGRHAVSRALASAVSLNAGGRACGWESMCVGFWVCHPCERSGYPSSGDRKRGTPFPSELASSAMREAPRAGEARW